MENEKNTEIMSADPPHEIRWYERQFSLDDAKTFIKANITTAARSFIAIGFYLKCVRDRELFLEDGYQSVWDFAKAEYGISMSTASRYMTMNDRFSQDGNSPNVKEEYKAFGKSQLQEMLALTDEQLEQVKPTDRVEDIRGMRKPKEIPYIELPGQHEIEVDFPDIFPEEEFEIPPSPSVRKQEFSMDIAELAELVEDVPEGAAEAQQIEESIAISQQEPEKLSAYRTLIKVYPEDSLLTTPGCEGGHDCFSCHLQCDIRQRYCYCVEAPTGNPFPCEQISRVDVFREEIGERCQFVDLDQAYHRAGDHEPIPCCKECKEPCQYACEISVKKREAEDRTPEPGALYFTLENKRTIDGAYGACLAAVVRTYLDDLNSRGLHPMSDNIPDIEVRAMGLEYQVMMGHEFAEFEPDRGQTVTVERKRLQAEYEFWYPAQKRAPESEPQPRAWNIYATACIHREEYSCTVPEAHKHIPGDGSNCGQSCCWECTKRGECKWECNSSQLRPEQVEPEPLETKPAILHVYEDPAPDENWKFGDLPQAKEKYVKSLARILVEKKGKLLKVNMFSSTLGDERIKWKLEDLAEETNRAIETGDDVIAYPCAEFIEFSRGNEDLGICSYTRFSTKVQKAFEEWTARRDSAPSPVRPADPEPVTDAEFEEIPEDRPYTMDMVMTEILRWKDRRESSKPGGTEPSEIMYKKACMMHDAMMALHTSMGGEYDEIA